MIVSLQVEAKPSKKVSCTLWILAAVDRNFLAIVGNLLLTLVFNGRI